MDRAKGKTILNIEHNTDSGYGGDDSLTILFTDGTKLVATSAWCNDGGSALDVEYEEKAPT